VLGALLPCPVVSRRRRIYFGVGYQAVLFDILLFLL
jgi:hypothetical protein